MNTDLRGLTNAPEQDRQTTNKLGLRFAAGFTWRKHNGEAGK